MIAPLAAALLLAAPFSASDTVSQASTATVRVPVANVWAKPGTATLPVDPRVWPTDRVSYSQRLALVGHMPTQVLYGETVRVLARRGAWVKVAVPDQPSPLDRRGYPGWMLARQLAAPTRDATVLVTARTAKLANGTEVGFGSLVPAGSVAAAATRRLPRTRADIVRTAQLFLGLHYLWGGLSAWGMDCSGLTWAAYRAHGITIPRDADAQYAAGRPISLEDAKPGDLLFYEPPSIGHVAMYLGKGMMIESPNSRSHVRIVPIRTSEFAGVRTFL